MNEITTIIQRQAITIIRAYDKINIYCILPKLRYYSKNNYEDFENFKNDICDDIHELSLDLKHNSDWYDVATMNENIYCINSLMVLYKRVRNEYFNYRGDI